MSKNFCIVFQLSITYLKNNRIIYLRRTALKKTLILLSLCLAPFSAHAANEAIINENMQEVLNQTNAEMQKSAEEMNKTLQQVMPQVA